MNCSLKIERRYLTGALCLAILSCADTPDPANETPVDPEPGMYEITFSGKGLLEHAKNTLKSFCLTEVNRASFLHLLPENYYKMHPGCSVNRLPREGNAIAGEINCSADSKLASGMNSFVYSGTVAPEKVRVDVQMTFDSSIKDGSMSEAEAMQVKIAMKALEQMRFVINAKRTGECG